MKFQVDLSDCNEILINQNVSEKNTFISVFEAPSNVTDVGCQTWSYLKKQIYITSLYSLCSPCCTNCSSQNVGRFSGYDSNPSYYFHQIFIFDVVEHKIICCSFFLITEKQLFPTTTCFMPLQYNGKTEIFKSFVASQTDWIMQCHFDRPETV